MTLEQIKQAVLSGEAVYWKSTGYQVKRDSLGQWLIVPHHGAIVGLTWADGITLNGAEAEFFTVPGK